MFLLLLAYGGLACRPPVAPPAVAPEGPPEAIYFILVDRFANGDASNDATVDLQDPQAFHGGDLRGVIQNLDHIQRMGFDTVWLSPVFSMRTEPFFEHGAFHGYWVTDPWTVEPRFGTEAELRELSDALHARGMKLLLDVVYNHVSFDAPLLQEHPDWFHPAVPVTDWNDPYQRVFHQVHGLPDLAQENEAVYQWLWGWSRHWIDAVQPDGFRIDAVRHMPVEFLRRLSTDLKAYAGADFYLLGEVFDGDPVEVARTRVEGGLDAVFDFPMHYALLDVFCKDQPMGRIASVLAQDASYGGPDHLVTFLDNHDRPRILTACGEDRSRVEQSLTALFALRGTPAITYGTESWLSGGDEPANRGDMVFPADPALQARFPRGLRNRLQGDRTRVLQVERDWLAWASFDAEQATWSVLSRSDNTVEVDAGGIPLRLDHPGLARLTGPTPAAWLDPKPVQLQVQGTTDGLKLVGAGAALGNWDPARALPLPATLTLPPGTVAEYKLIQPNSDGSVRWEPGENRYLLVGDDAAGDNTAPLLLEWRAEVPIVEDEQRR